MTRKDFQQWLDQFPEDTEVRVFAESFGFVDAEPFDDQYEYDKKNGDLLLGKVRLSQY